NEQARDTVVDQIAESVNVSAHERQADAHRLKRGIRTGLPARRQTRNVGSEQVVGDSWAVPDELHRQAEFEGTLAERRSEPTVPDHGHVPASLGTLRRVNQE